MERDALSRQIPYYLTASAKSELKKALEAFDLNKSIYANNRNPEPLQGDGWTGLKVVNLRSLETRKIRGIILSNSCDISLENERYVPPRITFAPILRLQDIEQKYRASSQFKKSGEEGVNGLSASIRAQRKTDMFYLPGIAGAHEDSVAMLGDVHSIDLELFAANEDRERVFSLSQFGHWLFLFKLSIHFCRFHEEVDRAGV